MGLKKLTSKLNKRSKRKTKGDTFEVIVELHSVASLSRSLDNAYVFFAWKRGVNAGTTLKAKVGVGRASWSDSAVNVQCTMVRRKKNPEAFEEKELSLVLKENDAGKKKKSFVGKVKLDLASYAQKCGETEFDSHFLKLDLKDEASANAGQLSCTLKIRRDPTGSLYGTDRTLSTASQNSLSAADFDDDDLSSTFVSSNDEEGAAETIEQASPSVPIKVDQPTSPAPKAPSLPKSGSARRKDRDVNGLRRKSSARSNSSKPSSSSSKDRTPQQARRTKNNSSRDPKLDVFTPPPQLSRRSKSNLGDPLEDDGMHMVATASLVRNRHRSMDANDPTANPAATEIPTSSPRRTSEQVRPVTVSSTGEVVTAAPRSPLATSQRGGSLRGVDGESSPSPSRRDNFAITKMESLRIDNRRKYGQRGKQDAKDIKSPRAPDMTTSAPADVEKRTVAHTESSALLREKDAELTMLKQQLAEQQREEDRRFFVEEIVVFMEPSYSEADGMPVAAYVIFRTLVHWDAFDASAPRFVSSVLDAFDKVLKRNAQNRDVLMYALATSTTLLHLLRTELGGQTVAMNKSGPTSDNGSWGEASSVASSPQHRQSPLEAIEPQLGDIAHAFFSRLVSWLVAQTDTLLVPAMLEGDMNHPERNAAPKARLLDVLQDWYTAATDGHHLHNSTVEQLFVGAFDQLGQKLLTAMLERRDLCSCGNGLQSKMNIMALEQWGQSHKLTLRPSLAAIMQAADVLVMNKTAMLEESTRADVCPDLNPAQVYRLLTLYAPDEYDPDTVHPGVLKQMATLSQNSTRPLHPRVKLARLDPRLGGRRFDLGSAAVKTPRTLLQRPGFAFLSAGGMPANLVDEADDAPW